MSSAKSVPDFLKEGCALYPLPYIQAYCLRLCFPPSKEKVINFVVQARENGFVVLHYINAKGGSIRLQFSEGFSVVPREAEFYLVSGDAYGNSYPFLGHRIFGVGFVEVPEGYSRREFFNSLKKLKKTWAFSSDKLRQNKVPSFLMR